MESFGEFHPANTEPEPVAESVEDQQENRENAPESPFGYLIGMFGFERTVEMTTVETTLRQMIDEYWDAPNAEVAADIKKDILKVMGTYDDLARNQATSPDKLLGKRVNTARMHYNLGLELDDNTLVNIAWANLFQEGGVFETLEGTWDMISPEEAADLPAKVAELQQFMQG